MDRETNILQHIITHCENIMQAKNRFGNSFDIFSKDIDYFNSVSMGLLQIGELANHLSDDFMKRHNDIPWKEVVGLRNRVVHGYGLLKKEIVWESVDNDVPVLYARCKVIVEGSKSGLDI
jgi:uncharacterized protein with HEPN domain